MKAGKKPLEFPVSASIYHSGSGISRTTVPQPSGHRQRVSKGLCHGGRIVDHLVQQVGVKGKKEALKARV